MSDLNIALILRFIDQATGPARAAMRQVEEFGRQQSAAGRSQVETANAQLMALRRQAFALAGVGFASYQALRPAVEFEAQMDRVGAVSGASAEEQERLTATARELGATTPFSAAQAARGMEFLAMAGFDVNETIAAMPGLLNLSAAAGSDFSRTADIASNILSGFNLRADQSGRLGDVLVNTFTSSNTSLEQLGTTMSYVAPDAVAAGMALEQTAAMAGLLGNYGIQGERAGTALRAVLARLAAPSNEATAALAALNVQVADEAGNLRDLPTILADLDTAMASLGSADRANALNTIFGIEAATAAQVLMAEAGSGALQAYAQELSASGSAAEVAERMTGNAAGAMRRLASAAQELQLALGDALLPMLTELVERLTPIVQTAGAWLAENQELVATIGALAAGLIAVNAAILVAQGGFWLLFGWVGKTRIAFGLLAQIVGAFGLGAAEGAFRTFRATASAEMAGLATTIDDRAGFIEGRIRSLRTRALIGMAGVAYTIMNMPDPVIVDPDDTESRAEQRQQVATRFERAVRAIPGVETLMGLYEHTFTAVHGHDAPVNPALMQGVAMQNAAELVQGYTGRIDLPSADRIARLREDTALAREEVAVLEAQLATIEGPTNAYDPGSPEWQIATSELEGARAVLETVEAQLWQTETEAAALQNALMVVGETDVAPEIDTASIDRALLRVRELSTRITALDGTAAAPRSATVAGGQAGGVRPDGSRATGGSVRPGFVYEINEQGREFFMPDTPGRVIPAAALRVAQSMGDPARFGPSNLAGDLVALLDRLRWAHGAADRGTPLGTAAPGAGDLPGQAIPAAALQAARSASGLDSVEPSGLTGNLAAILDRLHPTQSPADRGAPIRLAAQIWGDTPRGAITAATLRATQSMRGLISAGPWGLADGPSVKPDQVRPVSATVDHAAPVRPSAPGF
ncbi:MAG: phage tail tape measure protein, partial [Rhodobacteraceae bacterium]|nr:phage tail tape measure protein [Paracoccaceae bacterium]